VDFSKNKFENNEKHQINYDLKQSQQATRRMQLKNIGYPHNIALPVKRVFLREKKKSPIWLVTTK